MYIEDKKDNITEKIRKCDQKRNKYRYAIHAEASQYQKHVKLDDVEVNHKKTMCEKEEIKTKIECRRRCFDSFEYTRHALFLIA